VLYVIILSAALDLVPATTPKGLVAFFNIFPALIVSHSLLERSTESPLTSPQTKVAWPLISRGKIQYARRVAFCTCASWLGIIVSNPSPLILDMLALLI
jgi:battenin